MGCGGAHHPGIWACRQGGGSGAPSWPPVSTAPSPLPAPLGGARPREAKPQHRQDASGHQAPPVGMPPPQSNAASPKHDLGVTGVPSMGTESQLFPRQAQEQRAGYGQPRWQDHTCPQGPGCPRDATAPGWHLARDRGMAGEEGGWLGHGHCHRSDYPARLQPPVDTVHQGSQCCLGGPEKCPGPWPPRRAVPRAPGSARCRRLWVCRDELHLTASSR